MPADHPLVADIEALKARHPHLPDATTPDPLAQQTAMADRLAYAQHEAEAWQQRAERTEQERGQARAELDTMRIALADLYHHAARVPAPTDGLTTTAYRAWLALGCPKTTPPAAVLLTDDNGEEQTEEQPLEETAGLTIHHPDDDHIKIYIDGQLVAEADHDEHGWAGMDAVERTALAVDRAVRAQLVDAQHERDQARAEIADALHDLQLAVGVDYTTIGSAAVEACRRIAVAEAERDAQHGRAMRHASERDEARYERDQASAEMAAALDEATALRHQLEQARAEIADRMRRRASDASPDPADAEDLYDYASEIHTLVATASAPADERTLVCGCGTAPDGAPWAAGCSPSCMEPEPPADDDQYAAGYQQAAADIADAIISHAASNPDPATDRTVRQCADIARHHARDDAGKAFPRGSRDTDTTSEGDRIDAPATGPQTAAQPAAPALGLQDIPPEWTLALMRDNHTGVNHDAGPLMDCCWTSYHRRALQAAYRTGYAAALGYEITVSPEGDQVHIGDRPAETPAGQIPTPAVAAWAALLTQAEADRDQARAAGDVYRRQYHQAAAERDALRAEIAQWPGHPIARVLAAVDQATPCQDQEEATVDDA